VGLTNEKSQASTWRSWLEGERVSEDFMEEREQDILSGEYLEEPVNKFV